MPVRLAACLASAAAALAQMPMPAERSFDRAIADLADPAHAAAAVEALVRAGGAACGPLAELVRVPQRYVEPRARVCNALYALGRLGAEAMPVLSVIEDATHDRDLEVRRNAIWALGEVGPHADEAHRQQLAQRLPVRTFAEQVAHARLVLGTAPEPASWRERLASTAAEVVAACRLVRAPLPLALQPDPVRRQWRELVHARLAAALLPLALPWDPCPLRPAASDLAAAWFELGGEGGDLLVGRGLLQHWQPQLRRRALALVAAARDEALPVRAELLPVLFDPEAELRQLAAWTFGRWGRSGLVALPALRRLARIEHDVGARMACAAAADDLVRAAGDAHCGALVTAVEARLGEPAAAPPLPVPAEPPLQQLLVEILCGAEWCDGATVRRLLPEPAPGSAVPPALALAVLRYGANVDAELRAIAAAWLCRHGRAAGVDGVERMLCQAALLSGSDDGALVEAFAWICAGPGAGDDELRHALAHPSVRVVARAVAERIARGGRLDEGDEALLRASLEHPDGVWDAGRVVHLQDGTTGDVFELEPDLALEARAATTLLLAAAGRGTVDHAPLEVLAPAGGDAAGWVRSQVEGGAFALLAQRLEARVRELLRVPAGVAPR